MIRVDFFKDPNDRLKGFTVKGHAGLADFGHDVCCASVSSAVMMAANTVTEVFKIKAKVAVNENEIMLKLGDNADENGDKVLLGLLIHIYNLCDEFPGGIIVKVHDAA